jgi:hypothetical protein
VGENTKFFHRIATRSFRSNYIAQIRTEDDRIVCDHDEKASIIWHTFKDRVGQTNDPAMLFNLFEIVHPNADIDFSALEAPFTRDEIDAIVKNMPTDKSPGPDGFNGAFLKRCWSFIKEEFYKLCSAFHSGSLDIQSINSAFVTLIPKKDNPELVNDYRPISLVSLALKFLTKILANRMQKVIIPIIHKNQYGFIKSRTIHDYLAWAFEYIHLCHKSKREIVILKLDFEKAFDKVEYSAIILMLKHLGFGDIWIN